MIDCCVAEQGFDVRDKNYMVNKKLKMPLETSIIYGSNLELLEKIIDHANEECPVVDLPERNGRPHDV